MRIVSAASGCGQRLPQHLRLQVEEGERLRDRVVQLLREQVALLGDGELAVARGEPQALDRDAEVLAEALQHVPLLARGSRARRGRTG